MSIHGKYVYSTLALEKERKEETALRKEKEAVWCYVHVHVHVYLHVYVCEILSKYHKNALKVVPTLVWEAQGF